MQRHPKSGFVCAPENRTQKMPYYYYMSWKINEGYLTKSFWLLCVLSPFSFPPFPLFFAPSSVLLLFWSFLQRDCCQLHLYYVHCIHYAQLFLLSNDVMADDPTLSLNKTQQMANNREKKLTSIRNTIKIVCSTRWRCKRNIFNDCSNLHRNIL